MIDWVIRRSELESFESQKHLLLTIDSNAPCVVIRSFIALTSYELRGAEDSPAL